MKNRFSNNKTFTPFTHGARGETFLSQFILYPLRATSATRGTLAEMRFYTLTIIGCIFEYNLIRMCFMKRIFLFISIIAIIFCVACEEESNNKPTINDTGEYIPLAKNNTWTYLRYNFSTQEIDTVIISIYDTTRIFNNIFTYDWIMDYPNGDYKHYNVEKNVDSLTFHTFPTGGYYYQFKYPFIVGNNWMGQSSLSSFSVFKIDSIEISDELYRVYVIDCQFQAPQATQNTERLWIVRGIGIIRFRNLYPDPILSGYIKNDSLSLLDWDLK